MIMIIVNMVMIIVFNADLDSECDNSIIRLINTFQYLMSLHYSIDAFDLFEIAHSNKQLGKLSIGGV
jgi:hypothetical protein